MVPLCSGGPDKSKRMSVLLMGGENPHALIRLLFFTQCGRKEHRDADKLLGGELTRVLFSFSFFFLSQEAALYPLGKDSELAVIIGQPFERHRDSDRRNTGY